MTNEQFNEKEQWRREVMLVCKNLDEPHMWHTWNTFPQPAQKVQTSHPPDPGAPRRTLSQSRPQRLKKTEVEVKVKYRPGSLFPQP